MFVRSKPTSDYILLRIPSHWEDKGIDDQDATEKIDVSAEAPEPNVCSPSVVDPASTGEWMEKLLPSSTQWIIFEDKEKDNEGAIEQSDTLAESRELSPKVLIHGTRGDDGGEEDAAAKPPYNKYLLKFRLRHPDQSVDPDTNTISSSSSDDSD